MEFPVTVSPESAGFRASAGEPFNLTADGPTADDALAALRAAVVAKLQSGQVRTLTVTNPTAIIDAARKLGESPLFEDWVQAVEEYRREHNTVPEAD